MINFEFILTFKFDLYFGFRIRMSRSRRGNTLGRGLEVGQQAALLRRVDQVVSKKGRRAALSPGIDVIKDLHES